MDPDRLKPFTLITVTAFAALQLTYEPHVDTPPEQTLPLVGTLSVHVQEEILALAPKAAETAHIREFCTELITGDEVGEAEGDSDGVEEGIVVGATEGDVVGDEVQVVVRVPKFLVTAELKQDA